MNIIQWLLENYDFDLADTEDREKAHRMILGSSLDEISEFLNTVVMLENIQDIIDLVSEQYVLLVDKE